MIKKYEKFSFGFTLIELLIVITIIGILVTMGSMSYTKSLNRARDAKKITEVKEIQKALEVYYSIKGIYPTTANFATEIVNYYKGDIDDYNYTLTSGVYCLCSPKLLFDASNYDEIEGIRDGNNCDGATEGIFFCVGSMQ